MPLTFTEADFDKPKALEFTEADFEAAPSRLTFTDQDFEPASQPKKQVSNLPPAKEPVGTFRSVIGSLARGVSQNVSGTLKAIGEGSAALGRLTGLGEGDPEKLDTFRAGQAIQKGTEELFPVNPEASQGFWTGDVPQGLGQVASMVTGAGIVKGVLQKGLTSLGAKVAKEVATKAAIRSALVSSAGSEYDDAYQRSIARGDDPDLAATKAAGYAVLATAIESKLGVGRVLKRFGIGETPTLKAIGEAATGSLVKTGLKEGIAGFSEEALQRISQDYIVDGNLDWNAISREGGAGAVIQALLGIAGHAVHRKGARSTLEWIQDKQQNGITPEDAKASGFNDATLKELKIPIRSAPKEERQVDLANVQEETDPATLQRIADFTAQRLAAEDAMLPPTSAPRLQPSVAPELAMTAEAQARLNAQRAAADSSMMPPTDASPVQPSVSPKMGIIAAEIPKAQEAVGKLPEPEKVIAVAFRDPQGKVIAGNPGEIHATMLARIGPEGLNYEDGGKPPGYEAGFITNRGRYVGRMEAEQLSGITDSGPLVAQQKAEAARPAPTAPPAVPPVSATEVKAIKKPNAAELERIAYRASLALEKAEKQGASESVLEPLRQEVKRTEDAAIAAEEATEVKAVAPKGVPKVKQPRPRTAAQEFDDLVADGEAYGLGWGTDLEISATRSARQKDQRKNQQNATSVKGGLAEDAKTKAAARKALGDIGATGMDVNPTAENKAKFLPKLKEYLAKKAEEANAPDTIDDLPDNVPHDPDDPFSQPPPNVETVEGRSTQMERFRGAVKLAADSPDKLRVSDVDRVMSEISKNEVEDFRTWLLSKALPEETTKAVIDWTPEAAPIPKLRPGEKQGDVFANQTEDFALVGEKATDAQRVAEAKAKSERDAAEAKAIQDKQQQDLFSAPAAEPKPFGSDNVLISTARAEELKKRIKDKLKRTNLGVDPSIFSDAVQLGAYYIEGGFHKFTDWSAKMLEDFGDAIKDHLRSIYETARITIESPSGQDRSKQPPGLQPGLRPPGERIVVARSEFTKQADESIIPEETSKHLDPHQKQGVATALKSLDERGGFLLADGTGAGKTRQALAVADYYAKQGKRVIIVTKSETIKQDWKKNTFGGSYGYDSGQMGIKVTLDRDGSSKPGSIGITTYENLGQVSNHTDGNTVLIFDESHALKNDSQRAKHGLRAIAKAKSVMFMSATPADKAEHIYYLARIGVMEGKSVEQALRDLGMTLVTVDKMVNEGGKFVKRRVTFWAEDQRVSEQERNQRFNALFNRMTANGAMLKREISMDGTHVQVLKISLPPEAHDTMAEILRFFDASHIDDLKGLKKAIVLGHQRRQQEPYKVASTVMLAQRELAAGRQVVIFVSRVNASEVGKWVKVQGMGGESERIREVLMSSEGTAKTMREALEDAGIHDIAEIHGNSDQNSLEAMADFQAGKKRVVIATIESGGTGINLDDVVGNRPRSMIVVTAPFDAVGNVQAAGRIWRLKTLSGSNLFYLFGDTDVDDWNADIIGSKMSTLGAVVEGQVRRLDISNPESVTTDEYHEKVQRQDKEEAPAVSTSFPALDWKPFKTKAGKEKFVAPATDEFWTWYNANGKGDNTLGVRPSKWQDAWQVWSDKPITPEPPNPTVRESKGGFVGNPISEQAATQAVLKALGVKTLPPNIRFTNNTEDPAGRVVMLPGFLPQIELNLAKIGSPQQLIDILHEELIHPLQQDPEFKALFDAVNALVTAEGIQQQIADNYDPAIAPEEAANEMTRLMANRNPFQRLIDWIVRKVKELFRINLNKVETGRAAARILLQQAVKNQAAKAAGERRAESAWGENKRAETLRNSIKDTAVRRVLGRQEREAGVEYALQQFADVGLKVYRGNADLLFIDPQERHFDNQPALERLLERVKQTIARSRELPDYGNVFIQSVREMMAGQATQEQRGEAVMFTNRDTFAQLQQLSRAYFSELGQRLGMMAKNSNGHDVFDILEGPMDLVDRIVFEVDQGYFGGVGGQTVQTIIDEIKNQAGNEVATDESVADAVENILVKVTPPDPGSIVYKLAQGRLKPKQKAKLAQQLANARVQEAVQSIIELAKANGIKEPPSNTVPLTPSQKLFEMVKPTTVEKIDAAVQEAVRQAERNAGRAAFEADTGGNQDEMALYDAETLKEGDGGGVGPTPEQVERGMNTAEFSHWRVIRDNLLGYSPVTDKLIQKVIRSEFKGADFSDPTKPKPVDPRTLDLNQLAIQPDSEVNRVFQAYLDTVASGMDMQKASPVTKQRILATINAEIVKQLALARTRVNDPFFAPPRQPHAKPSKDQALRDALNAGIFSDPRINLPDMVTRVASRGAIKRLLPNIPELIKTVLATPVKDQKELGQIFADELSRKLDVSPEQADKAGEVFAQAYRTKFNAARETALKAASEALSPEQKAILFKNGKQLWEKIEDFVRAGGMDSNEFFKAFAKSKNWKTPTDADINKLRDLIERANELQRLTPQETTKAAGDPAKLETARKERLKVLETELMLLRRKIEAMVKEWGAPTARNPLEWFTDPILRRNWNAARNELNSANVLLGPAKFARQLLDTITFQMWYIPHRAIANTWNGFKNQLLNGQDPDRIELFKNLSSDLGQVLKVRVQTIAHSLRAFQQGVRGRGLPTHIEQLQSGMMMAERLNMRAEELAKKGDPASKVRSFLMRLWALQTLGHRQFGAIDLLQAKSSEWQEMMSQTIAGLREKGAMSAELQQERVNDIFGNIAADLISAKNDAEVILSEGGKTPTEGEINLAAWELLQARLYARIQALELPADEFEARNKAYTQTIAWNRSPEGPGAFLIANPLKGIQKGVEPFFPLPTAMFGNAMGTSLNRALTWFGFGLFPNMFKNQQTGQSDPWYETDVDKLHRQTEAITGLTLQGILGSMVLLGIIVVRLGWPKDKKEREEWQAKGISPYTIEFPLGNGQSLKIPLRIGPLAPMAGGLAAASAVRGLLDKKAKEQAKLNEDAAKLGVEPGKATPIGAADLLGVAGTAAWNMMAGGRTASGMMGTYSDFGNLNVGRIMSGFVSPMVPLLPAYQEMTRLAGVQIDPNSGSFWDMLVPTPWSPVKRVNMLGDDVSTPGAIERIIGITTLGGGLTSGKSENTAYASLYGTGARPQAISRTKGYDFNGTLRPMTREELANYARTRGTNLKQELMSLGPVDGMSPEDARTAVQAAIKSADQKALASMGVTARQQAAPGARQASSRSFGRRTRQLRPSRSRRYGTGRIKRFRMPKFTGSRSRRRALTRTKRRSLIA